VAGGERRRRQAALPTKRSSPDVNPTEISGLASSFHLGAQSLQLRARRARRVLPPRQVPRLKVRENFFERLVVSYRGPHRKKALTSFNVLDTGFGSRIRSYAPARTKYGDRASE